MAHTFQLCTAHARLRGEQPLDAGGSTSLALTRPAAGLPPPHPPSGVRGIVWASLSSWARGSR
jgi:hypothetical protein